MVTVPLGRDYDRQDCALARALEVVGERWTLLVLRDCFFGVRRFADLRAHLDIPRAVLSERLAHPRRRRNPRTPALRRRPRRVRAHRHGPRPLARGVQPRPAGATGTAWARTAGRRRFRHADCPAGGADLADGGVCPACGTLPAPATLETRPLEPDAGADGERHVRDDAVSLALRRPHRLLAPLP